MEGGRYGRHRGHNGKERVSGRLSAQGRSDVWLGHEEMTKLREKRRVKHRKASDNRCFPTLSKGEEREKDQRKVENRKLVSFSLPLAPLFFLSFAGRLTCDPTTAFWAFCGRLANSA